MTTSYLLSGQGWNIVSALTCRLWLYNKNIIYYQQSIEIVAKVPYFDQLVDKNKYLLTEWEGHTGKLVWPEVRTSGRRVAWV